MINIAGQECPAQIFVRRQFVVTAADLRKRLTPLIRGEISGRKARCFKNIAHKGIWVEPDLLAEIAYRAKSIKGKMRHPFMRGIREDL